MHRTHHAPSWHVATVVATFAAMTSGLYAVAYANAPITDSADILAQWIPDGAPNTPQVKEARLVIKQEPAGIRRVWLVTDTTGQPWYRVRVNDGREGYLTAAQFSRALYAETANYGTLFYVLNITAWSSLLWVAIGLLGQVAFTGRMVVQWLSSEKARKSVVPPAFWWMSLLGASMLIVYFVWRKDAVGILGQSTGWFIYVRNLYFIYARPTGDAERTPHGWTWRTG